MGFEARTDVNMKDRMRRHSVRTVLGVLAASLAIYGQTSRQYNDPVSQLDRKLASGEIKLEFRDDRHGYLVSLLQQLGLNRDSQVLVFAKNSLQQAFINPKAPRALYFNDNILLGAVHEGPLIEMISLDPEAGLVFHTLETRKVEKPRLKRELGNCLTCHGPVNRWAPGLIVPTVFPAADGTPFFKSGGEMFALTDHRVPFAERWGGFYVTGTHGKVTHRGNATFTDESRPFDLDLGRSGNLTSLAGRFDLARYLEPTSDVVALMTLEHQAMMTNMVVRLGSLFRASASFPLPAGELNAEVEKLVAFMLFVEEVKMESPFKGVSTFTETFPKRGPRDSKGRSLRDFDLQTKLFKYPLSYMIYSEAFDGLPAPAREQIYRKLHDVLIGKGGSAYASLSADRRREVLEILVETKKGLPEYFKQ
jgi:hypothetical protein